MVQNTKLYDKLILMVLCPLLLEPHQSPNRRFFDKKHQIEPTKLHTSKVFKNQNISKHMIEYWYGKSKQIKQQNLWFLTGTLSFEPISPQHPLTTK